MEHLLDYALRSRGIRLLVCELIRSTKARLWVFCMILLLLGLASRVPNEVKEASIKLRGSSVYFSSANTAIWLDEESPRSSPAKTSTEFHIQDIVLLPDDILLLIRLPGNNDDPPTDFSLPPKEQLTCLFNSVIPTSLTGLDYSRGRVLVRCSRPPKDTANIVLVERVDSGDGKLSNSSLMHSDEGKQFFGVCLLKGSEVIAGLANTQASMHVKTWHSLVFEMWPTKKDVVLFAKGINMKQGHNVSPGELVCVFGDVDGAPDDTAAQVIETNVSMSAQEVFRCAHPPRKHRRSLIGKAVTLRWGEKVLPSVVYYEEFIVTDMQKDAGAPALAATAHMPAQGHMPAAARQIPAQRHIPVAVGHMPAAQKKICVCTMVFNVAKFLPEWATFHSHVGVDRFILYDNNSEDELAEALRWLRDRHLEVSRYPWPWPKTQEAGFSHCVLAARQHCEWVLFADVDEFLFPAAHLPPSGRATPIRKLITEATRRGEPRWQQKDGAAPPARNAKHVAVTGEQSTVTTPPGGQAGRGGKPNIVGQISFFCRDFGPSNLTHHPTQGVTQGYVCRTKQLLRHKSLVKVVAVSHDLQNVVHHFNLRPAYTTLAVHPNRAVVNHYKYQAWLEFRHKFRRRVSAYVVDWKEQRNMGSRDRTPGLGSENMKPADWETAFCETIDTGLRDYCKTTFAVNGSTLAWQLS